MDIRPYTPADRDACLAVFDSNTPDFFKGHERRHFVDFLESPNCFYFVMEQDDAVVGCGGYFIANEKARARLVWGMVRRDWQRQGLGRFLLLFRLRVITKAGGVQRVDVDTSQHSAAFFESQGFKVARVARDRDASGNSGFSSDCYCRRSLPPGGAAAVNDKVGAFVRVLDRIGGPTPLVNVNRDHSPLCGSTGRSYLARGN